MQYVTFQNKGRAIRCQQMMHNLQNVYANNAGYYLNHAPEETRDYLETKDKDIKWYLSENSSKIKM